MPPMSPPLAKRRFRWFRFSLRTLMLAIAVIALWLGHYIGWIRQRHEMLERLVDAAPVEVAVLRNGVPKIDELPARGPFPWPLRLLGEKSHTPIIAPGEKSNRQDEAVAAEACRLFPEACIQFANEEPFRIFDEDAKTSPAQR